MVNVIEETRKAKQAAREVRVLSIEKRNRILQKFANQLREQTDTILKANQIDMKIAKESNRSEAFCERLLLTKERIEAIASGIESIVQLDDPLNRILEDKILESGIHLQKKTVPMGCIGIIFESRPNVSADCAALCMKAGSSCVLKGGKESISSCRAIIACMKQALREENVDENAVILLEVTTHEETTQFMHCRESLDLLIPRGSSNLIQTVVKKATVPVIETGAGICHVFVDESANLEMAKAIVINAKCSRPSVCNAMETLLVHEKVAKQFLPILQETLKEYDIKIHGDKQTVEILPMAVLASDENYHTEYNDYEMNIRIVKNVEEAIDHIETYGTHHSESIISEDGKNVEMFFNQIDSACLYHNASTRFTDGGMFGMGAEIGISTQKLHARGPMGLNELTTYAYYLEGKGEIR